MGGVLSGKVSLRREHILNDSAAQAEEFAEKVFTSIAIDLNG
jgi:hypothetical protein